MYFLNQGTVRAKEELNRWSMCTKVFCLGYLELYSYDSASKGNLDGWSICSKTFSWGMAWILFTLSLQFQKNLVSDLPVAWQAEISTSAGTSWNEDGKANQKFSRRASLRSPHTFVGGELCGFGFIKLVQVNWSWLLGTFYGRLVVIIWVFSIDQQSWTGIVTTSSACIIQYQLSNGFFNADILYAWREVFTAVDNHQLLVLLTNIANLIPLTRSDL